MGYPIERAGTWGAGARCSDRPRSRNRHPGRRLRPPRGGDGCRTVTEGVLVATLPRGESLRSGGAGGFTASGGGACGSGGEGERTMESRSSSFFPLSPRSGRHPLRERSDRHPLKPRKRLPPPEPKATPPHVSGKPQVSDSAPPATRRTQSPAWQPLAGHAGVQKWRRPQGRQ